MTQYYGSYAKAYVSVDCIIFGFDEGKIKLLLGHRQMNPGMGQWSLYGGFVKPNESIDDASSRVLNELTGLQNVYMRQVGAYGAVDRDPGSRVVSIAYCALINVKDYDEQLRAMYGQQWIAIEELPTLYSDHLDMVHDALALLRNRIVYEPLCFRLLPKMFTLTQLQNVYEGILGRELDKRNFRKSVKQLSCIIETAIIDKSTSKRGAMLYQYDATKLTHFHLS